MADKQPPVGATRDETNETREKQLQELQQRHPEVDMKLDAKWWEPGTDFCFDVKEQLDEQTNDRLNATLRSIYTKRLTPDEAAQVLEDAKKNLEGHPDLMARFDAMFGSLTPEFWQAWDKHKEENGNTCGLGKNGDECGLVRKSDRINLHICAFTPMSIGTWQKSAMACAM